MKKSVLFIFAYILIISVQAQQHFTNYASKNDVRAIAEKGNQIWVGTSGGLSVRSKANGAMMFSYSSENGLPGNYITDILVNALDNSVWVTTHSGLAKFDGTNWVTYTTDDGLPTNWLQSITIDQSGQIWVYGGRYLTKLEADGSFSHYWLPEGDTDYGGCIVADPSGNIWFTAWDAGVFKFNPNDETFTQYTGHFGPYDRIEDIIVDANGVLWFLANWALASYDGTNWDLYTTDDGLEGFSECLSIDNDGYLWIGSWSSGITKFDPTGTNTQTYDSENLSGIIRDITVDGNNKVWVGSTKVLNRYTPTTDTWNSYVVSNSISNNNIVDVKIDASNNIWVATFTGGLNRYNGSNWTSWSESDGLYDYMIWSLQIDDNGNVWVGYNNGLSFLDVSTGTISNIDLLNTSDFTRANHILCNSDGTVWVATNHGLQYVNGDNITSYTTSDGLVGNYCRALLKDASGNLWIGTSQGISVWDGNTFTNYTSTDGLPNSSIKSLFLDDNNDIYAVVNSHGVYLWDGSNWSHIDSDFDGSNEMAKDTYGNYWFVGDYGVKKYDGINIATYTVDDGLAATEVSCIVIDPSGAKWLGTEAGLSKGVCETPVPAFINDTACLPGLTHFTNTSGVVDACTKYEWDINSDASIDFTGFEPSYGFATEGTYSVKLTASNDNCSDFVVQDVTTYNTPFVQTTLSDTVQICDGSSASIGLQGGSGLSTIYNEDFSDADLASSGWLTGGDSPSNWSIDNSNEAGGSASELKMSWNPQFTGLTWVSSPQLNVSAYQNLTLTFKHMVNHYAGDYIIGVKTSSDGINWNTIWSITVNDDIEATSQSVSISNADVGSATFQLAFYFEGSSYDIDYWYIDDVEINGTSVGSGGSISPNYTYLWSNGSTSSSIDVSDEGDYWVTVNNNGCTYTSNTVSIDVLEPMEVPICMVSVDHDLPQEKNLIVWEKPVTESIDHFNIYREVTTDNYQLIGTKAYAEMSEFIDDDSQPAVHADKYKISTVDTCGNESPLSPYHQTINLGQALGSDPDVIVLSWNKYIDESGDYIPAEYKIYRGLDADNMDFVDALSGSLSQYIYNAPNVVDNEKFKVVVEFPEGCAPSGSSKASGGPYYQSTSNVEDEGIINTKLRALDHSQWQIFPNPVSHKAVVISNEVINTIRIYSVVGELVRQYTDINALEFEIVKGDLSSGTYILELNGLNKRTLVVE